MKPTNVVYEDDGYEYSMVFDWKGRRIRLWRAMKPQFIEAGYIFIGGEHADLVPPVKYTNPAWGVTTPVLMEGLADDQDLIAAWEAFAKAVDDGTIQANLGGQT